MTKLQSNLKKALTEVTQTSMEWTEEEYCRQNGFDINNREFTDPFEDCKTLEDGEKVFIQVTPNVRALFVVNVKEISYEKNQWEVTLKPYTSS